jgi:hypothetical protein
MNHIVNGSADHDCVELILGNIAIGCHGMALSQAIVRISHDEVVLTMHGDRDALTAIARVFPREMVVRKLEIGSTHPDGIMLWGLLQAIVAATGAEVDPHVIARAMGGLSYRVSAMYPTMQTDRCEAVVHILMNEMTGDAMRKMFLDILASY